MKKEFVIIEEIWSPCVPEDAMMVTMQGQGLEKIAVIANGIPIYLKKDYVLETRQITQKEYELLK